MGQPLVSITRRILALCGVALLVAAVPNRAVADHELRSGWYIGSSLPAKIGVGFRPDVVVIKATTAQFAHISTSTMPPGMSVALADNSNPQTGLIDSLTADGFEVTGNGAVNGLLVTYFWTAIKASPEAVEVGTYTGDGVASRWVPTTSRIGYLMIMGENNERRIHRYSGQAIGQSARFDQGGTHSDIFDFGTTGFQLSGTNEANEAGVTFHYIAFDSAAISVGSYLGDGTDGRAISTNDPGIVIVTNTSRNTDPMYRVDAATVGGASYFTDELNSTGTIGTLDAAGFTVDSADETNRAGDTYQWMAMSATPGSNLELKAAAVPSTADVGDTVTILVSLENLGPSDVGSVQVNASLPAGLTRRSHNVSSGNYAPGTGLWTIGAGIAAGAIDTLWIAVEVESGFEGQTIADSVFVSFSDQPDPEAENNVAPYQVSVTSGQPAPLLVDVPGSVQPNEVTHEDGPFAFQISLDNQSSTGVLLDVSSQITMSDGMHTYSALLANPTWVPGNAQGFPIAFNTSSLPPALDTNRLYPLTLDLIGVDDFSSPYVSSFTTIGSNEVWVTEPWIDVAASAIGNDAASPGDTSKVALAFTLTNNYGNSKNLTALTLVNASSGPGSNANLDAQISRVRVFDVFGGAALGEGTFSNGALTINVSPNLNIPSGESRTLNILVDVDSTLARDGDRIDVMIDDHAAIVFSGPTLVDTTVTALNPLDSFGSLSVDGSLSHQYVAAPSSQTQLVSGTTNQHLFTLFPPANGYSADTLTSITVADSTGSINPSNLTTVKLWLDDGSNLFEPGSDTFVATFGFTGDRYVASGFSIPVSGTTSFHVAADVALTVNDGDQLTPVIPINGIGVTSGNDGPLNSLVATGSSFTLVQVQEVAINAVALPSLAIDPGQPDVRLQHLQLVNNSPTAIALDSLRITNVSTGAGTQADLDAGVGLIRVYHDNGNGLLDIGDLLLGTGFFASGQTTIATGLNLDGNDLAELLVIADVPIACAHDGNTIAVSVESAGDVVTPGGTPPIVGTFPLGGSINTVDGAVAAQFTVAADSDSLLLTDQFDNLVLNVMIPSNGVTGDTLVAFTIENLGTATTDHIQRLALYRDGGDGVFDAANGDDLWLGDFVGLNATTFLVTGLTQVLDPTCADVRLFVAADLVDDVPGGASIQFQLPLNGVQYTSSNNGPRDAPVTSPTIQLIPVPDIITVFPYSVGDAVVHPGSPDLLNFGLGFYNGLDSPVTLQEMLLSQIGSAGGAELEAAHAYADVDSNGLFTPADIADVGLVTTDGVEYSFSNLNLSLSPQKITYLFVAYDLALICRDSVTIDFQLANVDDLKFEETTVVIQGEPFANSPGLDTANGMVAAQITSTRQPAYRAAPGEQNVPVFGLTIPANGAQPDLLSAFAITSSGTAVPGADISLMNLWIETEDAKSGFSELSDQLLASLVWSGSDWRTVTALNQPIPTTGLPCYVTANINSGAADERTIVAELPVNGITVASGNDGPLDRVISNVNVTTISTDPLLASLSTDAPSFSVGQQFSVSMRIRNQGATPLTGVHSSVLSASGTGSASVVSGPSISGFDLAAGADTTATWLLQATSAGNIEWCGQAFNADSSEVTAQTCTPTIAIQNSPANIVATFTSTAPPGVTADQDDVSLWSLAVDYSGADTSFASVVLRSIGFSVDDGAGTNRAPNSALRAARIISSTGTNFSSPLDLQDTNPVAIVFPSPVKIDPGDIVTLTMRGDIATSPTLAPMGLRFDDISQLETSDANSDGAITPTTVQAYPWNTGAIQITTPAETLRVSNADTSSVTANTGQSNVALMELSFFNESPATSSNILVTDFALGIVDSTGSLIAPTDVASRISVYAGATQIFTTTSLPTFAATFNIDLTTDILVAPQTDQPVTITFDAQDFPSEAKFRARLFSPASISARDAADGHAVTVVSNGNPFPMWSRSVTFAQPATGLAIVHSSTSPPAVVPGQSPVSLMSLRVAHADTAANAAPIRVDSLALEFGTPSGSPVFPGSVFDIICIMEGSDTLAAVTSLSGSSPLAPCAFDQPLVLAPGDTATLQVVVDISPAVQPVVFMARMEASFWGAYDSNSGERVTGVAGQFPQVSQPTEIQLPTSQLLCDLQSLLPANVIQGEVDVEVLDVVLSNENPAGYSVAELREVTFTLVDSKGSGLSANEFVATAELYRGQQLISTGQVGSSGIVMPIGVGLVQCGPESQETLMLKVELAQPAANRSFRIQIEDNAALDIREAGSGTAITPVARSGAFPLTTNAATILGTSLAESFTNYPNPFAAGRDNTRITFVLESESRVTLKLYTLWGKEVTTILDNSTLMAGLHQDSQWDGRTSNGDVVNNGVYYLVLETFPTNGGSAATVRRKVAVVR